MSTAEPQHRYVLTLACPSAAGQVAAVASFLDAHRGYIDELTVFDDDISTRFFLRCVFHQVLQPGAGERFDLAGLRDEFALVACKHEMTWAIHDLRMRPKVLIMVSKLEHCLADLLFRWRMGELQMDIAGIASNVCGPRRTPHRACDV